MGYITPDYYKNEYMGQDAGDQIDKYIERASDAIDIATNYVLKGVQFEQLAHFLQDQVKKAVAAQVEYYVVMGGDAEVNAGQSNVGNVQIGSFSYGSRQSAAQKDSFLSPNALNYLSATGLLYSGIGVVQNAVY
jgi:hypothetical protein